MKIEKESDALNREYKDLVRTTERLLKKYHFGVNPDQDQILQSRLNQIYERQEQIVDELEECTGVKIRMTEEEFLAEQRMIQLERNRVNDRVRQTIDDGREEEEMKKWENVRKVKLQERIARGNVKGQTKLFEEE